MDDRVIFEMKKGHGKYRRAMAFHYFVTAVIILPLSILALLVMFNPFWFRQAAMDGFADLCDGLIYWRAYRAYKIYLGTDPEFGIL